MLTVLSETPIETRRIRLYLRALTGSWAAGDLLHASALESLGRPHHMITGLAALEAVSRLWNGPAGKLIEAGAGRSASRGNTEQRRVAAMTPRVREMFLLTSIARLGLPDAARVTGSDAAEVGALLAEARACWAADGPRRALIIEDEPLIARDLERIVSDLGHAVVGKAATRAKAVALFPVLNPDFVLADMKLLDKSCGVEAVNEILDLVGDLPVIFVTAYPTQLLCERRPGPTFLVSKPYVVAEVRAAVTEVLYFGATSSRARAPSVGDGPPLVEFGA